MKRTWEKLVIKRWLLTEIIHLIEKTTYERKFWQQKNNLFCFFRIAELIVKRPHWNNLSHIPFRVHQYSQIGILICWREKIVGRETVNIWNITNLKVDEMMKISHLLSWILKRDSWGNWRLKTINKYQLRMPWLSLRKLNSATIIEGKYIKMEFV